MLNSKLQIAERTLAMKKSPSIWHFFA